MTTILDIDVIGRPRPKGSMRHVGRGRMVEQVDNRDWRAMVTATARANLRGEWRRQPCRAPMAVTIDLRITPPRTSRASHPSTRTSGDADKHSRLILDALQDAGVMRDDAQVVRLAVCKRHCRPGEVAGARITVAAVDHLAEPVRAGDPQPSLWETS